MVRPKEEGGRVVEGASPGAQLKGYLPGGLEGCHARVSFDGGERDVPR